MNNRQANRRRGRSNNNRGQQNRGGYDHQNRIDNRARGNAAQMLEKYKKLASDAQMNGDRVQAEYYFQFADHYFRVQADVAARKEEQDRNRRPNSDSNEDRRPQRRDERNDRGDDFDNDDDNDRDARDDRSERNDRGDRDDRNERDDRGDREERGARGERKSAPKPRARRPRDSDDGGTIDNSVLPPAINASEDEDDKKPARKPRARRPRAAESDEQADAAE